MFSKIMDVSAILSITSTSFALVCAGYALYHRSTMAMGYVVIIGLVGGLSRAVALVFNRLNERK